MAYTDSVTVTTTLPLQGVWISDTSPEVLAAVHYPFGKAQRDHSIDPMGTASWYAGRESPVFDYGEHSDVNLGITVDVPNGPTYLAEIEALEAYATTRRPAWVRDNRGRVVHGILSGFKVTDTAWGAVVSFTVTKTHRDVTTAVT